VSTYVLSEARILVAGLKSIARRPLERVEVKPGWRSFGAMRTSSYGNTVTVLLLLIAVEAPALHLILGAVMDDGALRETIRGLLLGSSIYLAPWLIGDLRLLRETPGVLLGKDMLVVAMGLRVNGEVGLEAVTGARVLEADDAVPTDGSRAIRITPQPRPNCRIQLRSTVSMRGIFGAPLRGDVLDVYVDEPAELVEAIETAIAATNV
jgi:hypothetical protein